MVHMMIMTAGKGEEPYRVPVRSIAMATTAMEVGMEAEVGTKTGMGTMIPSELLPVLGHSCLMAIRIRTRKALPV